MEDGGRTLGIIPSGPDEYGPAPAARWSQPWSRQVVAVLTALGAVAVGFLITAGIVAGRSEAVVQDARKQALIEVIRDRQARVDGLAGQLEDLRARVALAEAETSAAAGAPARRALARVEELAGMRAVRGPGLRVELHDAGPGCRGSQPQDCRIHDTDVQLVVNALFAAGAEAVGVNAERVVSTTAIRSAGGAILVNYRVLSAPYTIEAVGDGAALGPGFAASDVARDFAVWTETYGLGFSARQVEQVDVPAYTGGLRVQHARVVDGPATAGGDAP